MKTLKRGKQSRPAEPARIAAVPIVGVGTSAGGLEEAGASAAYLASIVQSSQDAIASFSPDGIIQSWNPGAESLFGYSEAEAIGQHVSVFATQDYFEEVERMLRLGADGKRVPSFETIRKRKDGSLVDVEVSRSPIMQGGRVIAVAAIWRDISGRKLAEKKIRESEERFRAILENSLDAAYRRNLQTDGYDYLSPAIELITGFTAEELGSKPLSAILKSIHPADVRLVQTKLKKSMASGEACRGLEYRFRCKDGSYRWLAESFRVVRDDASRPLHIVGIVRDISERKDMEAALYESRRLARSTVEAIPAQIAVIDASGIILDVNKAWRSFALANGGTDETTGCGVNYLKTCDRVHGMERDEAMRFASGVRAVLKGRRRMFFLEYPCHSPTEKRWFTAYVTPFAGEGERRAVIAHVNITAVKRAEEATRTLNSELEERVAARTAALLDANRSLQRAMVERRRLENEVIDASEMERQRIGRDLHDDLGQQLAGLWFFSAVLEKRLREKHSEDAPAAARISELLDKSLSLTRSLARGLHPVVAEPGGLMAALRALSGQCSELFKVRCRFACRRPVHVHGSSTATHLFRIAQEAVTNAGKHSKAKQITIQLSSPGKKLVLSVSDDGVGLRKARRKQEGLGFRTMQYRADALGGSLVFRQRRGGGTIVVCTIPEPGPASDGAPQS